MNDNTRKGVSTSLKWATCPWAEHWSFFGRIVEKLGSVRPEAPGVCSLLSKSSRSERYPVPARRAIPPSAKGEGAKGERPQRRLATNWAQRYLVARASPPAPSPFAEGEQTINQTPFAPVSTLVLGGAAAPLRDSPRNLSEVDRPLLEIRLQNPHQVSLVHYDHVIKTVPPCAAN